MLLFAYAQERARIWYGPNQISRKNNTRRVPSFCGLVMRILGTFRNVKTQCADFRSYGGSGAVALAAALFIRRCYNRPINHAGCTRVFCNNRARARSLAFYAVAAGVAERGVVVCSQCIGHGWLDTDIYIHMYSKLYNTDTSKQTGWARCGFWQKQTTAHWTQHTPCSFACKSCTWNSRNAYVFFLLLHARNEKAWTEHTTMMRMTLVDGRGRQKERSLAGWFIWLAVTCVRLWLHMFGFFEGFMFAHRVTPRNTR